MKNDKLDKVLKENLEKRRISPSDSGWEKLSARLEKEEEKRRKPLKWIGIAAVFLGGILIGGLVFQKTNGPDINPVVNTPIQNKEKETGIPGKTFELDKKVPEQKIAVSKDENKGKPTVKNTANQILMHPKTTSLPKSEQKSETEEVHSSLALTADTVQLGQQADKIIQAVMEKNQIATVTDAEIEKLLKQARTEIDLEKQFTWPEENHVDAQALLRSVEQEIDPSYKEKLYQFVEDKLIQLALATRVSR